MNTIVHRAARHLPSAKKQTDRQTYRQTKVGALSPQEIQRNKEAKPEQSPRTRARLRVPLTYLRPTNAASNGATVPSTGLLLLPTSMRVVVHGRAYDPTCN